MSKTAVKFIGLIFDIVSRSAGMRALFILLYEVTTK